MKTQYQSGATSSKTDNNTWILTSTNPIQNFIPQPPKNISASGKNTSYNMSTVLKIYTIYTHADLPSINLLIQG